MKFYLSIGTNVGNREENLIDAVNKISRIGAIKTSTVYRTEPWGREEQPEFFNACLSLSTSISPTQLLSSLQDIEKEMGREKRGKWKKRLIDIDILLVDNLIFRSNSLMIPHKFLHQRRFYLEPLNEISQEEQDPVTGKSIRTLLKECRDRKNVWKTGITL